MRYYCNGCKDNREGGGLRAVVSGDKRKGMKATRIKTAAAPSYYESEVKGKLEGKTSARDQSKYQELQGGKGKEPKALHSGYCGRKRLLLKVQRNKEIHSKKRKN